MKTTITTHTARTAHANASLAPMARAYEGFLEMPVAVVLVAMWVGGAALLGSCALALCMAGSLLVSGIAGAL
jgi:nucleoside phosphorylase